MSSARTCTNLSPVGDNVSNMAADDGCLLNEETCLVASDECRQGIRGHGGRAKKENQQARYWSYLFDNLHRVVDEIFCTCEADRSIIECQVSNFNVFSCSSVYLPLWHTMRFV